MFGDHDISAPQIGVSGLPIRSPNDLGTRMSPQSMHSPFYIGSAVAAGNRHIPSLNDMSSAAAIARPTPVHPGLHAGLPYNFLSLWHGLPAKLPTAFPLSSALSKLPPTVALPGLPAKELTGDHLRSIASPCDDVNRVKTTPSSGEVRGVHSQTQTASLDSGVDDPLKISEPILPGRNFPWFYHPYHPDLLR